MPNLNSFSPLECSSKLQIQLTATCLSSKPHLPPEAFLIRCSSGTLHSYCNCYYNVNFFISHWGSSHTPAEASLVNDTQQIPNEYQTLGGEQGRNDLSPLLKVCSCCLPSCPSSPTTKTFEGLASLEHQLSREHQHIYSMQPFDCIV